jgi:hypothetical protein
MICSPIIDINEILYIEMSFSILEFAGFVDANGRLGRPVPSGHIVVPGRVWREGDSIRWRMGKTARSLEASKSMLNQFVRLTDSESILRFAKRWGVLALSDDDTVPRPGRRHMREGIEPIAAWQYYSRRAQAVLQIAAALKQDKLGDLNDWSRIGILVPSSGLTKSHVESLKAMMDLPHFGMSFNLFAMGNSPEENLTLARQFVAVEVGKWLDCWKEEQTTISDFALRWNDVQRRWDLQIDYHGLLFAAVALQLALVVADADSLYSCSGCGVPYIRSRERKRPKCGWANYCEQCSKDGVAQRRAVESYREKRVQAVRMHSSGIPVQKIAEQLNSNATRIRGWLKKA